MNILIADDSDIIRATITKSLQTMKNIDTIYEANDVPRAIEMLRQHKPDIALIDIKMPGGSGFDVLKVAKQVDINSLSIMLTNYTFKHYQNKSFDGGADYFFDKALEFEKVFVTINEYINKKTN
ncbi:MAG: response regulator transcription factor [bacterium]